ncbi:hypothetical protein NE237_007491 [Protea cynaroides]|uniref:Uncharacterized protein n=1 Tax=Protea cynaroides TaxID=273540 RepID=A0A9Q0KPB1_9MAGN|nr:hypothetical protein NE237_007491 [Protea cynaroides]
MGSSCNQQNNNGILQVEGQGGDDHIDSVSSSSDILRDSISSSLSDFLDDATTTTEFSLDQLSSNGPLRGLSKYFQGKSQSFTSLSNVRSVEDLAKPENPYNKKLKSCKSKGGLSENQNLGLPKSERPSQRSLYNQNLGLPKSAQSPSQRSLDI